MKLEKKAFEQVTLRSALIALLIIPFNSYWVLYLSYVFDSNRPSSLALLFNVIFIILILMALNALIKKILPIKGLSQVELLTIYAMLCQATVFAGRDMVQVLVPLLSNGFWYARPENEWAELFHAYLPRWLVVSDRKVIRGFYEGNSSLYEEGHYLPWIKPLAIWTGFIAVMSFTMLCLSVIVRKQWSEREKLTYPVVRLPLEMTRPGGALFKNGLMWLGAGIAMTLNSINALGQMFPQIPYLPLYKQVWLTEKPWSAMNSPGFRFSIFPFAIGLGYFIPLDLAFSCWFFYLFWQFERVLGSAMGWSAAGFPFHIAQLQGTWMGLFVFAIWSGRRYFISVFKTAFGLGREDDSGEAFSYRLAVWGAILGSAAMILFGFKVGMSLWFSILFFGIYLAMSVTVARVRAELGPPAHDFYNAGPDTILPSFLGTRLIGKESLSGMTLFFWINHLSYRAHPMPHQLEALWLARMTNANARRLAWFLILAAVFGTITAAWGHLHISYRLGLDNCRSWYARAAYSRLASWCYNPTGPDRAGIIFAGVGFLFTVSLLSLRKRFLWFPLHPVGYVVSSWWTFSGLWFPMLIAWLSKRFILRMGGAKGYRRAMPFFLGLIIGDVIAASIFSIISSAMGIRVVYLRW